MEGNAAVHMNIGQKLRIEAPLMLEGSMLHGPFCLPDKIMNVNGVTKTLYNGFFLENELVGSLEVVKDCLAVIYTHKQPFSNIVYFITNQRTMGVVNIIGVSVHDHSSIYQGGPAHGTYSSEVNLQSNS